MKTRAIITIILSLIIGFILGFVVSSQITRHRLKDVKSMSSPRSFKERVYEIIEADPEQREILNDFLDQYGERFDSLRKSMSGNFHEFTDRFHADIQPYITDEQLESLKKFGKGSGKHHDKKQGKDGKDQNEEK